MIGIAGAFLLFFVTIGVPVSFALAAAVFVGYAAFEPSFATILTQRFYAGMSTFTMLAIPFFVAAGLIMESSGISRRLVSFATALMGWATGGLLHVAIVTATILAAISGSGTADTAAVSAALQPELKRRGYNIGISAAYISCASALAAVIPPSLIMIVLAMTSNLSIGKLFLGGVLPGLLAALLLILSVFVTARRDPEIFRPTARFSLLVLGKEFFHAVPALAMPAIILGGILGGVFTATESAAVACAYGFLVGVFVYRELTWDAFRRLLGKAAAYSSALMFIVGAANVVSWLVANEGLPVKIATLLEAAIDSRILFLLAVNLLLLAVGMFLEAAAAILILSPILFPVASSYGIDPVHFGVLLTLNLSIGLVTPPFGLNIFVASLASDMSVGRVIREIPLPLFILIVTLFVTTFVPELSLFLPSLVFE